MIAAMTFMYSWYFGSSYAWLQRNEEYTQYPDENPGCSLHWLVMLYQAA
jgi:hypothetical protein